MMTIEILMTIGMLLLLMMQLMLYKVNILYMWLIILMNYYLLIMIVKSHPFCLNVALMLVTCRYPGLALVVITSSSCRLGCSDT
jgi:hypothetical protein